MKKTLIALALIGALVAGMVSCINVDKENTTTEATGTKEIVTSYEVVTVTDEDGSSEIVTDAEGDTVTQVVTVAGGLEQGGANTEGGFGPIHRPN